MGRFSFPPWSIIIDRRLLQRIGGFDPLIKIYVDVEFSSRLLPATQKLVETFAPFYVYRRRRDSLSAINSRRKAAESLRTLRQTHRNLAPYLVGREDQVAQCLFTYCVQAYPYWTNEHRRTMAEAHRQARRQSVRPLLRRRAEGKVGCAASRLAGGSAR